MKKIIWILLLVTTALTAQTSETRINEYYLGYSGAFPNAPIGAGFGQINKEGIGFYGTVKFDGQNPTEEEYMSNVSYNQAKHTYKDEEKSEINVDISVTLGMTYNILEQFILYGGLSYFEITQYTRFFDSFYILGNGGDYVVMGPDDSEVLIGLNFGIIYKVIPDENSVILSAGYNLNPNVFEFGVGYSFNFYNYYNQ